MYIHDSLFLSWFSTRHTTPPTLYLFPNSVHNTLHHPRFISLLFHYITLYITHAVFPSCFSIKLCISTTIYLSPVSVHNNIYNALSINPLFQDTNLNINHAQFFLLFQYTTLYISQAIFLTCFSTQCCKLLTLYFSPVSVQKTVSNSRSNPILFQ